MCVSVYVGVFECVGGCIFECVRVCGCECE